MGNYTGVRAFDVKFCSVYLCLVQVSVDSVGDPHATMIRLTDKNNIKKRISLCGH